MEILHAHERRWDVGDVEDVDDPVVDSLDPWDMSLAELQRQYPEAVHLLKNAHTI